jgi:hypothetical protein
MLLKWGLPGWITFPQLLNVLCMENMIGIYIVALWVMEVVCASEMVIYWTTWYCNPDITINLHCCGNLRPLNHVCFYVVYIYSCNASINNSGFRLWSHAFFVEHWYDLFIANYVILISVCIFFSVRGQVKLSLFLIVIDMKTWGVEV